MDSKIIKTAKRSLLERYQKDHSTDLFIVNKGKKALELLEKSGYLSSNPESSVAHS